MDILKCNFDQDVIVTIDFTPSTMYHYLQVTVISDDGWRWGLACRQLGVLIVDVITLTNISSVQLGSLSNYIDVLQAVSQVQYLNEIISVHVRNLSDIWIYFLTKLDSLITTRLLFSASCSTFNNTSILFQSKAWFVIFH